MYYYKNFDCGVRIIFRSNSEDLAYKKEEERITELLQNKGNILTNIAFGGRGAKGVSPSIEQRKKVSEFFKLKWENDKNFIEKMLKLRRNPNGVYKSKEFREKISKIVSGKNNPNYNHKWSEEQKRKLSLKQKKNPLYWYSNNPNSRKIICLETNEIFNCIKYAMEKYNVKNETSFTVALNNKQKTAAGLHWRFYEEKYNNQIETFKELLLSCKLNEVSKPIICVDDFNVYPNKVSLAKTLNITEGKISRLIKKNNKFIINNKTYILL